LRISIRYFNASLPFSFSAEPIVASHVGGDIIFQSATCATICFWRKLKSGTTAEFIAFVFTRLDAVA
jgi:hypothetical protein